MDQDGALRAPVAGPASRSAPGGPALCAAPRSRSRPRFSISLPRETAPSPGQRVRNTSSSTLRTAQPYALTGYPFDGFDGAVRLNLADHVGSCGGLTVIGEFQRPRRADVCDVLVVPYERHARGETRASFTVPGHVMAACHAVDFL